MKVSALDLVKDTLFSEGLNKDIFLTDFNHQLVHQIVVSYMSNSRVFSKGWKNRSNVTGSNKKPWAQKGTGRARAGSKKSPLWRSGGVTFAYTSHNFSKKVNRKMYQKGISCILSELVRTGNLLVSNDVEFSSHKTKDLSTLLSSLNLHNILIIVKQINKNLFLAARNLPNVCVSESIDPVALMSYDQVLFEKEALKSLTLKL